MPYRNLQNVDPRVNVLLLEDSAIDADLIIEYLGKSSVPITVERVVSREEYLAAIERGGFRLILSDFSLPSFDGMTALAIAREKAPHVPFIFVSGVVGEEIAIECLKKGATDYVLKPRMSRLPAAVDRALKEALEREERQRVELRTRLLVAELSHRVKNTLMTVVSIARQTLRRSQTLPEFEGSFLGRIQALASAHALLLRGNWGDMDLQDLMAEALKPFRKRDGSNILVQGECVLLPPQLALTMNLIVHELATNAAKYGSLSTELGRVDVQWSVVDNGDPKLRLLWQERGGPTVTPPARKGFGTTLIQRSVSFEMDGEADLQFEPGGVRCELVFPLTAVQDRAGIEVRPDLTPARDGHATTPGP